MKRLIPLLLALTLLWGCNHQPAATLPSFTEPTTAGIPQTTIPINSSLFTDRDLSGTYEEGSSARITFSGDSVSCDSDAVKIDGSTVTITDEGTYILTGQLDNGMIIVNAGKQDKTQLVLAGVSIHANSCAPIYVLQADKVLLTLAEGTENTLSNGGAFTAIDENTIDAVIFSKEDLTLNGSGQLTVTSPAGHGIVSKDALTVTGGSYTVQSAAHGLDGQDRVCITGASLQITAGKDGIHAENDEDATLGFVHIDSGSFTIRAEGDGISAEAAMELIDGTYDIITGGGSVNAQKQTSDNWGGFPGGMGGGRPGGMGGPRGNLGSFGNTGTTEDSTSIKGIKAGGALTVSGGAYQLDCADDAIHSNSTLTVTGGSFQIATGDDGFHADEALLIRDGAITVTKSYEGLEGLSVEVTGGQISLNADDDGINAAGGTDQSGMGGFRGGDLFGSSSDSFVIVSGGTVSIRASGDGIDSNGALTISGGYTTVCGPTSGDTAVLDYGERSQGIITGGTFIGTGAYQMAVTFNDSQQGVISLSVGNQSAGTEFTLTDAQGKELVRYAPELNYAIVIISTPDIVKGDSYTFTIGDESGAFTAS